MRWSDTTIPSSLPLSYGVCATGGALLEGQKQVPRERGTAKHRSALMPREVDREPHA